MSKSFTSLCVVWFTYSKDAALTRIALRCARWALPGASLVVVNDAHDPISKSARKKLERLGSTVVDSTTRRGGNLRGEVWIKRQAEILRDAGLKTGAAVVVKTDPDTLLLSGDWLLSVINGDADAAGWLSSHENRRSWFGCAYAIRTEVLESVPTEVHASCADFNMRAHEDIVIGDAVRKVAKRQLIARDIRTAAAPELGCSGHFWGRKERADHYLNDVITFSPNWHGKEVTALEMNRIFNARKRYENE